MVPVPGKQSAKERLQAALRGAFAGPPTPLKDIPTKGGESRASQKSKRTRRKKNAGVGKPQRHAT